MNPFSILEEQRPTNTFTLTYDSKTLIAHNIIYRMRRKGKKKELKLTDRDWSETRKKKLTRARGKA